MKKAVYSSEKDCLLYNSKKSKKTESNVYFLLTSAQVKNVDKIGGGGSKIDTYNQCIPV